MLDDHVQSLLSATDAGARADAAEALARLGAEAREAAVALVRASGDRDSNVRDWAVAALEELGPPPAADVEPLAALATNPETNIAYWSCTLLGAAQGPGGARRAGADRRARQTSAARRSRAGRLGLGTDRAIGQGRLAGTGASRPIGRSEAQPPGAVRDQ